MSQYFGFELLLNAVREDLQEKQDLLVLVLHWLLIREGYLCLGTGTEREILDSDVRSELLPSGWNRDHESFLLRYFNSNLNKVVVLDVTLVNEEEVAVTIAENDSVCGGFGLKIPTYLGDLDLKSNTKTRVPELIPKIDELMYKFQFTYKDILSAPDQASTASSSKSAESKGESVVIQEVLRPRQPRPGPSFPSFNTQPRIPGIINDGRRDLDPFGYGSGFLPMRRDPVVPETNPDHFQPPGLFREDDPLGIPRNPLQQPRFNNPGFDWYG